MMSAEVYGYAAMFSPFLSQAENFCLLVCFLNKEILSYWDELWKEFALKTGTSRAPSPESGPFTVSLQWLTQLGTMKVRLRQR